MKFSSHHLQHMQAIKSQQIYEFENLIISIYPSGKGPVFKRGICHHLLFIKIKKPSSILPSHNCVKISSEFTKHNASLCQHQNTVPQLFGKVRALSSTSVHLSQVPQLAPTSGPLTMLLWMTIIPGRLCSWSPVRDKLEQLVKDNCSSLSAYGGEHSQQIAGWHKELLSWFPYP